jgi:hypothetical protein
LYIYIDESGTFNCFREARSSVSCVAALVIPESVHDSLLQEFERLAQSWGLGGQEVKGRLLNEHQFDQAIDLVYQTQRAFLRITAVDIGLHTETLIGDHKARQALDLIEPLRTLGPAHLIARRGDAPQRGAAPEGQRAEATEAAAEQVQDAVRINVRRLGLAEKLAQIEKMLLVGAALGEVGTLPLVVEVLGRHGRIIGDAKRVVQGGLQGASDRRSYTNQSMQP